jgi:tetratricopeptide (TPR) repeat protein
MIVLVVVFVGCYFASFLPFTVAGRYRAPVVPFLMLLSAVGIDRFRRLIAEHRFGLAAVWLAAGGLLVACAHFNASGYTPDHPRWHYDRGLAWGKTGRPELAVQELEEAVRLDGHYAEAHAALGYGFALLGRVEEAESAWKSAIAANPAYPQAYAYYGTYLLSAGRPREATAMLGTALRLNPDQESWKRELARARAALAKEAPAR